MNAYFRMMAICMSVLCLMTVAVQAAPIQVTGVTFDHALSSGRMAADTDYNLTSLTAGGTTHGNLEGGISANAASNDFVFGTYVDNSGGQYSDFPGSVSGVNLAFGLGNATSGTWQFSQTLDTYVGFAFFELGGQEAVNLSLVDASNAVVGTYTLSSSQYGGILALPPSAGWNRPAFTESPLPFGSTTGPAGTYFTLSDFVGTGEVSTATGFRLNGASGVDPFALVAVVPEPTSLLLLGVGGLLCLRSKRNA